MHLTVSPIKAEREEGKFELYKTILDALDKNKIKLEDGDVLVISSKYISNSQGRIIDLESVKPSEKGILLSKKLLLI